MPLRPLPLRRPRRRGFTLIEVMVAVGLTAVMLWGLLQLFTSATRFSSAVTNETELCAAGRAALERMVREITAAAPPNVAYLNIDGSGGFDYIEFVAPVGKGGAEMLHVKYHALADADGYLLARSSAGVSALAGMDAAPATYGEQASFGVRIEGLTIRHIPPGGSEPSHTSFSASAEDDLLPPAVLIELRLTDQRGLARITLSSAATLVAGGI